jgi:GAF domain-containing protein
MHHAITRHTNWYSIAIDSRRPAVLGFDELKALAPASKLAQRLLEKGVKSFCAVPLVSHERTLGTLNIGRLMESAFTPDDVDLAQEVSEGWGVASDGGLTLALDLELTDSLRREGQARELVRAIQDSARLTDYSITGSIVSGIPSPSPSTIRTTREVSATYSTPL